MWSYVLVAGLIIAAALIFIARRRASKFGSPPSVNDGSLQNKPRFGKEGGHDAGW